MTPCCVPFCRRGCPLLPSEAEVNRASGEGLCSCGKKLYGHPTVAYPTGMNHVTVDCEGRYWHL